MKIYMACDGEHDSWGPIQPFTTKEKAEAFCKSFTNTPDIIEYDLDNIPSRYKIPLGLKGYVIVLEENGLACLESRKIETAKEISECQEGWTQVDADYHTGSLYMTTYMFAADFDKAIEIAQIRRLRLIEQGRWNKEYTSISNKEE